MSTLRFTFPICCEKFKRRRGIVYFFLPEAGLKATDCELEKLKAGTSSSNILLQMLACFACFLCSILVEVIKPEVKSKSQCDNLICICLISLIVYNFRLSLHEHKQQKAVIGRITADKKINDKCFNAKNIAYMPLGIKLTFCIVGGYLLNSFTVASALDNKSGTKIVGKALLITTQSRTWSTNKAINKVPVDCIGKWELGPEKVHNRALIFGVNLVCLRRYKWKWWVVIKCGLAASHHDDLYIPLPMFSRDP